jgi:hypothetical protein
MLLCHFSKGELTGLDNLQGGPSIDPDTGLREYSKLASIIEMPEIRKIFHEVNNDISHDGKMSQNLKKTYEAAKSASLPFEEAPQDKKPPASIIEKEGRNGDKFLALIPKNVAIFLIELRGGYSTNPKTGLLEFGLFKSVKKFFSNPVKGVVHAVKKTFGPEGLKVAGTIGGAFFGGPLGAGLGSAATNMATGAGFGKSLSRGLGAYGLATGAQALGQMGGLGASTPYTNGFFGGSNPVMGMLGKSGATNPSMPMSAVGMINPASAASMATPAAAPSFMGNIGNAVSGIAQSPLAMMGGLAFLNHRADKKAMKEQNRLASLHNSEVDRMKEEMGYNLPPISDQGRKRWVRNPKYTMYNRENPYLDEPQPYKKGGIIKPNVINSKDIKSFVKSTGIYGPGNGQEDKIRTSIPSGSYIIDASSTADLGDGSSTAGIEALEKSVKHIRSKYPQKVVKNVEHSIKKKAALTPVFVAKEEFKIDPVTVALAGGGNIKKGASMFKTMVRNLRRHKNSNGLGLPPAARDPLYYLKKSHK